MTKDQQDLPLNKTTVKPGYPALTIDYALYERHLEESGWTEAQKREFLDALWSIMVQFVDLGFGIHPAQQAGNGPYGHGDCFDKSHPGPASIMLDSNSLPKTHFADAAESSLPMSADKDSE